MPQRPSRDEAIELNLVPELLKIDVDPDTVNLEAIARKTVNSTRALGQSTPMWQNNVTGAALRRLVEQHMRP